MVQFCGSCTLRRILVQTDWNSHTGLSDWINYYFPLCLSTFSPLTPFFSAWVVVNISLFQTELWQNEIITCSSVTQAALDFCPGSTLNCLSVQTEARVCLLNMWQLHPVVLHSVDLDMNFFGSKTNKPKQDFSNCPPEVHSCPGTCRRGGSGGWSAFPFPKWIKGAPSQLILCGFCHFLPQISSKHFIQFNTTNVCKYLMF